MSDAGWRVIVTYVAEDMEWVIDVLTPAGGHATLYHKNWPPPNDQRATQTHIADQLADLDRMFGERYGIDPDPDPSALPGLRGTLRDPHPAVEHWSSHSAGRWVTAGEPWMRFEVLPPKEIDNHD